MKAPVSKFCCASHNTTVMKEIAFQQNWSDIVVSPDPYILPRAYLSRPPIKNVRVIKPKKCLRLRVI